MSYYNLTIAWTPASYSLRPELVECEILPLSTFAELERRLRAPNALAPEAVFYEARTSRLNPIQRTEASILRRLFSSANIV